VRPLDFIGAIELAYDPTGDDASWLDELTRVIAPSFSVGGPTTSFFYELIGDHPRIGTLASLGEKPYSREDYQRLQDAGIATETPPRVAYECEPFAVLSRVIGPAATTRLLRSGGMDGEDAIGLRGNMTPESGVVITTQVPRGFRLRDKSLWTRFAAHLGCALRLRQKHGPPAPSSAAAVLDTSGRLEHGTDETIAARARLAGSAKAMDRARGKLRRLDPDAASELWRTMVEGKWSLVDWVDHDGKRFILAQENQVPLTARKALSKREMQVLAFAAMGHSNKLIAYDLGLAAGTVAVLLSRAAQKLGVRGRVALIRAFREQEEAAQ
jgi:DNA-binding CsgD family transcriptional regulator